MSTLQPISNDNSSNTQSTNTASTTAVQVALRVRPLTEQDRKQSRLSNSVDSINVVKTYENSITIVPHQKSFQFDYVFDSTSTQEQVFTKVASNLVDRFTNGYNVTILAYGQTSSGKTYTMGTAIDDQISKNTEQEGIIPRAMTALFQRLCQLEKPPASQKTSTSSLNHVYKRTPSVPSTTSSNTNLRLPKRSTSLAKFNPVSIVSTPRRGSSTSLPLQSNTTVHSKSSRFTVHVSFIEIYNEELVDLLNPAPPNERAPVIIREDTKGHIIWSGIREVPVVNTEDVLRYLQMGTENRATGSTDMNAKSSRSHAIFSVTLKQEKWVSSSSNDRQSPNSTRPISGSNNRQSTLNVKAMIGQMEKQSSPSDEDEQGEWMVTNSKFHFVDLAGSERLKRTAAEGDRRKEGININAGLLALGNVIYALSDSSKRSTHVPYRDSKLTRLLQDSLGGNSTTLMIACVSPADVNLVETVNTIKYACRARNIRNKTEKNQAEEWMINDNVEHLRHIIAKLKAEIKTLKRSNQAYHAPSPLPSSNSSSQKSLVTHFNSNHVNVSPSSSVSDNEPNRSTYPSVSATTNSTLIESSTSLELCDIQVGQQHSNDVAIMIADLHRQIEELQNEVTVTRERNHLVESELRQKEQQQQQPHTNREFEHLVEPVIEEYEKSMSVLESQLATTKAALFRTEQMLTEQHAKMAEYESMQANEVTALEELKARLHKVLASSQSSKAYCFQLEEQLEKSAREGQKDQQILSELREKILSFKEMDEHTEQYIGDLEARLSASENERSKLEEKIAALALSDYASLDDHQEKNDNHTADCMRSPDHSQTLSHQGCCESHAKEIEQANANLAKKKEEHDILNKKLAECVEKCQLLKRDLALAKEKHQTDTEDKAIQCITYEEADLSNTIHLTKLLTEKESQIELLNTRLNEIEKMNCELNHLHQTHLHEISRLEQNLDQLQTSHQTQLIEEQERNQYLQKSIDSLVLAQEHDIKQAQDDYVKFQQETCKQQEAVQSTLQSQLIELEALKADLNALQHVEEKQDFLIQGLEAKLEGMERLASSLRSQLEERSQDAALLEKDNAEKAKVIKSIQIELENAVKDVDDLNVEKRELEQMMYFLEESLRRQVTKSDEAFTLVEEIKYQYNLHETEIEEKQRTFNLLSTEKEELSQTLEKSIQRVSQSDEMIQHLERELNEARQSLNKQTEMIKQFQQDQMQAELESQRVHALKTHIQGLEKKIEEHQLSELKKQEELTQLERAVQKQLAQNEGLVKTIATLESTIKKERVQTFSNGSTDMIADLENKLASLQETKKREDDLWKAQLEQAKLELYLSRKENQENEAMIKKLEKSLEKVELQLAKQDDKHNSTKSSMYNSDTVDVDNGINSVNGVSTNVEKLFSHSTFSKINELSNEELLEKINQLEEDKSQLLKHNDNLESQLVLQRSQLTLETKNLELELMKLSAANDRLEKEMEQVIPRNTKGTIGSQNNEDSTNFTSPPQTPRMSSPLFTVNGVTGNNSIQYMLQRDVSQSSIAKLSKSGSYRSVSTLAQDSMNYSTTNTIEEDIVKRLSTISVKSEVNASRSSSSLRGSRTHISAINLPPPTAPPSNPLPPIPTPLPPPPSSPTSPRLGYFSELTSDPGSPSLSSTIIGLSSQTSLHRQDSNTSTSFSELMNASSSSNITAEQYDKFIRSLQRKAQCAENDVRTHQEVISKLEMQLSHSESSMREAKRQLDLLSREKQAYNVEIQKLRTQVTQFQSQQKTLTDESVLERQELEQKLQEQIKLKEKAEKAKRILENRMEDLMNRKSKFMCF